MGQRYHPLNPLVLDPDVDPHIWTNPAFAGLPRDVVSYDLPGNKINNLMGVFSGLGTIAFTFGDAMLPEIQVRIVPHTRLESSARRLICQTKRLR